MKRVFVAILKLFFGLIFFFASAVYVVILVLGLLFINQADYRAELDEEQKSARKLETLEDEKNEIKLNVSKLPSDDQQDLKKSNTIKRTILRTDGKVLQAIKYLNFTEKVQAEIDAAPVPNLCEIICNPSGLDQEKLESDPYISVERFYVQNKNRALDDFNFRHAMEATKVVSLILTPRMREMYIHGLEIEKKNLFEQAVYVTKFQFAAGQAIYNISQLNKNFQNHEKKMDELLEIRKTCGYTSRKKVQKACDDILAAQNESELALVDKPKVRPSEPASSDPEEAVTDY